MVPVRVNNARVVIQNVELFRKMVKLFQPIDAILLSFHPDYLHLEGVDMIQTHCLRCRLDREFFLRLRFFVWFCFFFFFND